MGVGEIWSVGRNFDFETEVNAVPGNSASDEQCGPILGTENWICWVIEGRAPSATDLECPANAQIQLYSSASVATVMLSPLYLYLCLGRALAM